MINMFKLVLNNHTFILRSNEHITKEQHALWSQDVMNDIVELNAGFNFPYSTHIIPPGTIF